MPLPAVTPDGFPPPGRHPATLDEVRSMFVDSAPSPWHRESLFRLLEVELRLLSDLPGTQTAWLGGDFVSHAPHAGESVLVLGVCDGVESLDKALQTRGVEERVTVLDAVFGMPIIGVSPAIRPMGGFIDAFLASPRSLQSWDRIFSRVPQAPHMVRGYVEVML